MASQMEEESPLIAALPPQTDYITYLTILEYQLNSTNLSILTGLLNSDDGTLAKEIGWDLLKLVLRLSEEVPEEASKCLEVIARRGNPREVIIGIPEELKKLDQEVDGNVSDSDQQFEDDEDDEGLRTFEGEAPRLHLGTLSLDGMPPLPGTEASNKKVQLKGDEGSQPPESRNFAFTKFRIILSMLGTLHSRIRTEHPSRFLATSLTAALRAYRKLPIDVTTTTAFVSLLGKLSGKQRPALPPRKSTADIATNHPNAGTSGEILPAALPDPENDNEGTSHRAISADEAAIVQRLLQAVLLEVFEEYIESLGTQEPSSMSWTARLRAIGEPEKAIPNRQTEIEKWSTDPVLQKRDSILAEFVRLSKDLGMDQTTICKQTLDAPAVSEDSGGEAATEEARSPSEYPTAPEQIPFPPTGTFLIFTAEHLVPVLASPAAHRDGIHLPQEYLHWILLLTGNDYSFSDPALVYPLSTPVLDFFLAPLYAAARWGNSIPNSYSVLLYLTLFFHNPDPYIRDSAHATATIIFHQLSPAERIKAVVLLLINSPNQHLRAAAVKWVKDDIALKRPESLPPDTLTTQGLLRHALFNDLPQMSGTDLQRQLPFYVAVLNLMAVAPMAQEDDGGSPIDSLARLRHSLSEEDADDIPPVELWSFDDALQRARNAAERERDRATHTEH